MTPNEKHVAILAKAAESIKETSGKYIHEVQVFTAMQTLQEECDATDRESNMQLNMADIYITDLKAIIAQLREENNEQYKIISALESDVKELREEVNLRRQGKHNKPNLDNLFNIID